MQGFFMSDSLGRDIQRRLVLLQLIICEARIPQMQALVNQCTYLPFMLVPSANSFYSFVPFTPLSSDTSPSNQHQLSPSYFYSPQIDGFYLGGDSLSFVGESPTNLQQNREMSEFSNQTNIGGNHHEKGEFMHYSPIVLSYNGDSASSTQKSVEFPKTQNLEKKTLAKEKKGKSKSMVNEQDREYNPQGDRKKKVSQKYQQNQNRNIIPNEINQIFSFLQKRNKSGALVQKLCQKYNHPAEFTPKRYYLYQSLLKNKLGHYTNQKSLKLVTELYEPKCESWSEQEQRFYNKISRVLICHFLNQDSIFIILTSKRMKSDKKGDHLRARRFIKQSVLRILQGY